MTSIEEDLHEDVHPGRQSIGLVLAVLATIPGIVLRFTHSDLAHPLQALIFGLAIVGAAFLLSWAAEVAQLDISAGLAIAVLAFIAVLPEYVVDFIFARDGGRAFKEYGRACAPPGADAESNPCSLALANMTGANRLLIGVGWTMVIFVAWYRWRKRGDREAAKGVTLERSHSVELAFLTLATAYSLTLPLKRTLTLLDALVLVSIFAVYTVRIAKAPAEEPHLVGPARWIGNFATGQRRGSVLALFLFAGTVIFLCAEEFAHNLVESGEAVGISEFLLVQWLAPLASEAPELLVAGLYAWRLNTNAALGTLVSSKVNQWTLLVGTLPIAFAVSAGTTDGLPLVSLQREELLLTAAQSLFAIAVLVNLSMSVKEAWILFALFWAQFIAGAVVPESIHWLERVSVAALYVVLALWLFLRERVEFGKLLRRGFRAPYSQLVDPSFD